jgi:hypothetical protein
MKPLPAAIALRIAAWSLSALVSALAIITWGGDNGWLLGHLSTYQLFPVLGLVAFSLMWTHYVVGAIRELADVPRGALRQFYQYTGYLVLVLICLHPGLLIYQRFRDGYGLPPGSYEHYVAPGLGWITLLGTVSLLVFLSFELRRFFYQRSWWHFIPEVGDFAMLAIVYHGLRLGSQLHGWYRSVWWFYAVVLMIILIRSYAGKYARYRAHNA